MVNNPNLQIQILELFTVYGTCSRKEVLSALQRDDYGNIHDTMSRMESRMLIAFDHDTSGKGRPEKFFRMTTKGFEWMLRMQHDMKPSKFWELILGFVYQYPTDPHYIESIITDFIKRHITYQSAHKLFFILDKINDFCTNLILTKICLKGPRD